MLKHCLNWKVLAGLGAVALGVLVVSPGLFVRVLPWLIVAACPLSMLVMMAGMGAMQMKDGAGRSADDAAQAPQVAGLPCCSAPPPARVPARDQVAALKAQLAGLAAEQERIAHEIARLERDAAEGDAAGQTATGVRA